MAEVKNTLLKGQNLRVFVGGKVVALATSCTITLTSNLEDSSTKDTVSGWDEQELTGQSWSVQTDALFAVGETPADNTVNGEELTDLWLAGQAVDLSFNPTTGSNNQTTDETKTFAFAGSAWIASITITAANKQNSSMSAQFTGNGALSKA